MALSLEKLNKQLIILRTSDDLELFLSRNISLITIHLRKECMFLTRGNGGLCTSGILIVTEMIRGQGCPALQNFPCSKTSDYFLDHCHAVVASDDL
jgi:hypothetical protein